MTASLGLTLAGPFVVGLYSPATIAPSLALAAVGILVAARWRASSRAARWARATVLGLIGYVAACLALAFLVDRADRDFQEWFWEKKAGISPGMTYDEARRTALRRSTLHDPPYFADHFGPGSTFPKDYIVKPRGLARLHVVRYLMDENRYTLTIESNRDRRVVRVHVTGWDERTAMILTGRR